MTRENNDINMEKTGERHKYQEMSSDSRPSQTPPSPMEKLQDQQGTVKTNMQQTNKSEQNTQ